MKVYVITNTHRLIAVYDDPEKAEAAAESIRLSGVMDPNKLFCVEWDTDDSDARIAWFIKTGE